jgi:hypothetical protein
MSRSLAALSREIAQNIGTLTAERKKLTLGRPVLSELAPGIAD